MKSVVLVTFDSIRVDHCGFAGYERDTTPTLDRMADEGIVFENAIAPGPSTPEAMPVILTGSHPRSVAGSNCTEFVERQTMLREHMAARETLAERFSKAGYATAGFSPNPYTSRYFGFDEGFDAYEDFIDGSRERLYDGMLNGTLDGLDLQGLFPARVLFNWIQREEVFKPWEAFYDSILEWVRGTDRPYFLWVLLMDTHDPYLVPSSYRTQSRYATYRANWRLWRQGHAPPISERTRDRLVRAYDDTIRYSDAFLDRLLNDLPHDPLIVVHGDHGEAFGEHGTFGHQQRLYEENVHVPLVVHGGSTDTVADPFSLADLPELLLDLAVGDELDVDGTPAIARTLDGERTAIRGRNWKYLTGPDGDAAFDLTTDPGERSPLEELALYELCQIFVNSVVYSDREKRRIGGAVDQLRGKL
ncbi:sulfatase [Natronococcus pandeyae]|uniref:sulfatase n=1 Tax=Natronococcus pandeyae TaxID=2055836 RepID=UPI0016534105|nr:sulfatase [Natronococcus pandeyae]